MRQRCNVSRRHSVAVALAIATALPAAALAQAVDPYLSNGAQLTSVPARGQPGADYFSNGAQATSVNAQGANSAYFSNGAAATSVNAQSYAAYFSNGAQMTSVSGAGPEAAKFFSNGAQVTSVPARGEPGADYFSNGAQATSVPAAGQPGAEYFANGARSTRWMSHSEIVAAAAESERAQQAAAAEQARAREQAQAKQPAEAQPEQVAPQEEQDPQNANANADAPANAAPGTADSEHTETVEPASAVRAEPEAVETDQTQSAAPDEEGDESSLALPATSDHVGPGSRLRDTRVGSRPLAPPEPRADTAQPGQTSSLAKLVDTFAVGVFGYVVALAIMLAVLGIGVAYRIRRINAANARRALKQPVTIVH